jgi:hypothetical protein
VAACPPRPRLFDSVSSPTKPMMRRALTRERRRIEPSCCLQCQEVASSAIAFAREYAVCPRRDQRRQRSQKYYFFRQKWQETGQSLLSGFGSVVARALACRLLRFGGHHSAEALRLSDRPLGTRYGESPSSPGARRLLPPVVGLRSAQVMPTGLALPESWHFGGTACAPPGNPENGLSRSDPLVPGEPPTAGRD